jgi:hypothetical protein
MSVKKKLSWLLLLVRLPATHKAERVAIWRKLRKSGAVPLQTSTYLLPDDPSRYETFQWLTQHIRDAGGDATLIRAREIEGFPNDKLIALFNVARAREYSALSDLIRAGARNRRKRSTSVFMERIRKQFRDIRETDFFNCPRAQDVEMLLRKFEGAHSADAAVPKFRARDYTNKTWLTRPRPEIDRVGSAWLIRKFIDPKAKFIFAGRISTKKRSVISFDMLGADFTHRGDDCTFETLIKNFRIQDNAAGKIAEMIHDADLNDGKFERAECIGIDRVFKGWAREGLPDHEILRRGFQCFDALHAFLRRG